MKLKELRKIINSISKEYDNCEIATGVGDTGDGWGPGGLRNLYTVHVEGGYGNKKRKFVNFKFEFYPDVNYVSF